MPDGLAELVIGGADRAVQLADDPRVPLVSATGSTQMGKELAPRIAARFGRSLLELGGNNAAIVAPSADLDLAVRGVLFSAVGTAGQRCTSLRRLIVHESIADELVDRLASRLRASRSATRASRARSSGRSSAATRSPAWRRRSSGAGRRGRGRRGGGRALADEWPDAWYASPTLVADAGADGGRRAGDLRARSSTCCAYSEPEEAIALQNGVPQGLASSIFTDRPARGRALPLGAGSDCGIANVNIGPSGAEIGGAFGGEKETGGGRESGSDAWKAYMRRQTATVNFTSELPLAQGIVFDVP